MAAESGRGTPNWERLRKVMRVLRGVTLSLVVLAVLSILAAGCGGDREKAQQEARADCEGEIGPFMQQVTDLDSRLDLGLAYTEYSEHVGDAKVAHDRINLKSEVLRDDSDNSTNCLNAAVAAEGALDQYIKAQRTWNECVFGEGLHFDEECGKCLYDCSVDDIEAIIRANWSAAHKSLDSARKRLNTISPTSAT